MKQLYKKVKKQTDELDETIYKELYKYYDEMNKSDTKGSINPYASTTVGTAGVSLGAVGTMGVMGTGVYPGTGMMTTPMMTPMTTGVVTPTVATTMV